MECFDKALKHHFTYRPIITSFEKQNNPKHTRSLQKSHQDTKTPKDFDYRGY